MADKVILDESSMVNAYIASLVPIRMSEVSSSSNSSVIMHMHYNTYKHYIRAQQNYMCTCTQSDISTS